MKNQTTVNEILAAYAWAKAGNDNSDITDMASEIANTAGQSEAWLIIRYAILDGLESISDICVHGCDDASGMMGRAELDGTTAYWWHNNAESAWVQDEPEWWADQLQDWSK